MTTQIEAVYEQGILRPLTPLDLAEGERVEIILLKHAEKPPGQSAAALLAELAALPEEGPGDSFSGADHDAVLYGKRPER
jgi:predicted DNA-binding antitoxin AbrB/MazE fold protein